MQSESCEQEAPWPPPVDPLLEEPDPLLDPLLLPLPLLLPEPLLDPLVEPHALVRGVQADGSGFVMSAHFWRAVWLGQSQ